MTQLDYKLKDLAPEIASRVRNRLMMSVGRPMGIPFALIVAQEEAELASAGVPTEGSAEASAEASEPNPLDEALRIIHEQQERAAEALHERFFGNHS